ncbi:MAG: hypothetical protein VYD68_01920, partial [Pseudomonadota bacterium]|nr:hypothetical protein [Pseudomonadota bacterium]
AGSIDSTFHTAAAVRRHATICEFAPIKASTMNRILQVLLKQSQSGKPPQQSLYSRHPGRIDAAH